MNFTRIAFDRECFARSLDFADAAEISREVFECEAQVFSVDDEAQFIVRNEGTELVVVAFEGRNLRNIFSAIVQRATKLGFRTIRFHVKNPALARLVRHVNPTLREYVYEVKCGRQITQ